MKNLLNDLKFSIGYSGGPELNYIPLKIQITDSYNHLIIKELNISKPGTPYSSELKFHSNLIDSFKIYWKTF